MKNIIKIKLPNGSYLTAETNPDPNFHELFIGITDVNDRWLQDLAIVRNTYHYENGNMVTDDKMTVLVFADSENEDSTNEFNIDFWKGAE